MTTTLIGLATLGACEALAATDLPQGDPSRRIAGAFMSIGGGRLNVRARPTTASRVRDTLRSGAPVTVYGRSRTAPDRAGWLAITPAKDRWVHSRFGRTAR